MKSLLALHLLVLLLLQLVTMQFVGQTTASAIETVTPRASTSAATTTLQLPSLRAPHRTVTATTKVMSTQRRRTTAAPMTTTTTTKPTSTLTALTASAARRQRPPIARSSTSSSTSLLMAKNLASAIDKQATVNKSLQNPNSARPLRSINSQTRTSGARQNRSLLSQSATSSLSATTTANAQNNGGGSSRSSNSLIAAGKNDNNEQKHERVDLRYHSRTNHRSSGSSSINENKTLKTHATLAAQQQEQQPLAESTKNVSSGASSAERHHIPKVLEASHRQSKESSMPSAAVDTKLKQSNKDELEDDARNKKQAPQTSTKSRQTAKTPRMIHRLVAGHIQNAEGRSTYQVSSVTSNSSVSSSSTTLKPSSTSTQATIRRGTKPTKTSAKYSAHLASSSTSQAPTPVKLQSILDLHSLLSHDDENDDDEALLDDTGDFDNWDNGILRLSAGSGKENSKPKKHSKIDDSKKSLADQVRDGKYGLIEKELFRREPKRPGILSYLPNKEVPIDNEHNFGGLQEEDIWLAEDHLLVIKGGNLNEEKPNEEPWPAIDDYDAPGRQIKIPPNPKVPPPFPVQLEENGPLQFIGNNKFTVVYPIVNESIPVYSVGPETDQAFPETNGEDAKDSVARPGTPQDTASGEPQYVYPAPYPPWLYSNQTFVNPLLSNARPITFPRLGPFPFGRNGSLDNSNGTDYFDEDDPTLYYPPAYSFVYKNNYTNPVPPGPLVPGIVLPPPANHFSRLEKPERTQSTTPQTVPPRIRIPTTTASTTTTTTTTTTSTTTTAKPVTITTTEAPFRPIVTKISQYIPKIINITPETPTVSSVLPSTPIVKIPAIPLSPSITPTTPATLQFPVEPVPVPVAVPVPISIFPSRKYPTSRPSHISFVPTTPRQSLNTLSKSNPIYYEYFEAKRQPIKTNIIDDFLATTIDPPPSAKPIKLYATSKRPYKAHQPQHNYLQPLQPLPQQRKPIKENFVYITPKPDIRYKSASKLPLLKQRPLENFEREVDALRETLRYYQNQQLRDNSIPRTPKVKPIYEFTFDASKNLQRPENEFRPPLDFDDEPFKPMVTYSPPMNDENSFSPMPYDKVDGGSVQSKQLDDEPKYQSTTTLIPVQPDAEYQVQSQPQQGRLKTQRLSAKYLQESFIDSTFEPQPDPYNNRRPWVAIGKTSIDSYDTPQSPAEASQRYEQQYGLPKNRAYSGYYYGPPPPPVHSRQNNRFYDEPFRKIANYPRQRVNFNYQQQQPPPPPPHQQQQQQQQQQNYWNLENDTYVNYAPNRPPLNPDAEFIEPYQTLPINNGFTGHGRSVLPPALSHQSQYYPPPPSRPIPLHRDILVNYRQPLPPINPDSEFITHPQVVRQQGSNQIYRSDSYQRLPPPQPQSPLLDNNDEQANLYYASPKYRRANKNNNNGSSGGGNKHNNGNPPANANKQGREPRSSTHTDIDAKTNTNSDGVSDGHSATINNGK